MTMKTSQILNRIARFFTSEPSPSTSTLSSSLSLSASAPSGPVSSTTTPPPPPSKQTTIIEHYQTLQQSRSYAPKKSRWATLATGKKPGKKTLAAISTKWTDPTLEDSDSGISVSSTITESCTIPLSPIICAASTISVSSTFPVECVYDEKVEIQIPPAPTFAFRTKAAVIRGYRTMRSYPSSSSRCLSPVLEAPEEDTSRISVELKQNRAVSVTGPISLGNSVYDQKAIQLL
ncbi:hypothetical protein BD408DRAFT_428280 [Parasitella parasitica]|nr:hypothetical protein BD408DRAFT_428280 [Parasitella parasitica]